MSLPFYADVAEPLAPNHCHEAPRLPHRGSWLSKIIFSVVVLLCCGLMMLCLIIAIAVSGYKMDHRFIDGVPLFAQTQRVVDTNASPPPPVPNLSLVKLPAHVANQLHRIRQLEILDGNLSEENLKHIFPYWWDKDGIMKTDTAMVDVMTTLSHLSLILTSSSEDKSGVSNSR